MGTQQLLQLTLVAIIIGTTIMIGIGIFGSSATQANRDAVFRDLQHLTLIARKYYRTPSALGGGGRSFKDFTIPIGLANNENGSYQHTKTNHNTNHIHFEGVGQEEGKDGKNPIRIEVRIEINKIKWTEHN